MGRQPVQMQWSEPAVMYVVHVNASNTYCVVSKVRRLLSEKQLKNSWFLIQAFMKILVNLFFVEWNQQAEYSLLEVDPISMVLTFLFSSVFFNLPSLQQDCFFFWESYSNLFFNNCSFLISSSDASGSSLPCNLWPLYGIQTVHPFFNCSYPWWSPPSLSDVQKTSLLWPCTFITQRLHSNNPCNLPANKVNGFQSCYLLCRASASQIWK